MTIARKYAEDTSVPVERSEAAIKTLLKQHGATDIMTGEAALRAQVYFVMKGKHVRFTLPLPQVTDKAFRYDGRGSVRSSEGMTKVHEAELRRVWRALLLVIKGKIEAAESGICSFEHAFLPEIVMPDGQTMAEWALPRIERMYQLGKMPKTLPGLPAPEPEKKRDDSVVDAEFEDVGTVQGERL